LSLVGILYCTESPPNFHRSTRPHNLRHLCSAILAEAVAAVALLGEARAVAELVVALVVAHEALVSAEAAKEAGEAARAMVVAARGTEVVATARRLLRVD